MNAGELFGQHLRRRRLARGYSLADLSDLTGISRYAIGMYERGDRNCTAEIADLLAGALGAKLSDLMVAWLVPAPVDTPSVSDGELLDALTARIRRLADEAADPSTTAMGPRWGQVLLGELAVLVGAWKRLDAELKAVGFSETEAAA